MKSEEEIKKEIKRFKNLINKEQNYTPVFNVNFVREMIVIALEWVLGNG